MALLRLQNQSKEVAIDNLKKENLAMKAEILTFFKKNGGAAAENEKV